MRRLLILFIITHTLYACTDQSAETEVCMDVLRFGVTSIEDSKGSVITDHNGSNPLLSMAVFCSHSGQNRYSSTSTSNYMHNVQVSRAHSSAQWIIESGVNSQWKDDGYHSFFAFAPYGISGVQCSETTQQGPPRLTYTIPSNHVQQIDLMYSHTTLINGKQQYIGNRPVSFGFRHALSKITFEASKESTVTDVVTITSVALTGLKGKGMFSYLMNADYSEITGANWQLDALASPTDYVIRLSSLVGNTPTSLLPAAQALFLMPQTFQSGQKIRVTYNKGSQIGKTIEADLLSLTNNTGWSLGKAYRYKIIIKEDEVKLEAVLTTWNDQIIDVNLAGTYLNVSELSMAIEQGSTARIYYATDASNISVTNPSGAFSIVINKDAKYIEITPSIISTPANYLPEIRAGKLSRILPVLVKGRLVAEDGVAAPRIFVQGTDGESRLLLTKAPQNYGALFQFGGIVAWEYKPNQNKERAIFCPVVGLEWHNSNWRSDALHTLSNLKVGKGDPCRLVGYSQAEVQEMLGIGIIPDNKTWKTPAWVDNDPIFHVVANRPSGWSVVSRVNGHFFPYVTSTDNFLPAAGIAWDAGWMEPTRGEIGAYWTNSPQDVDQGRLLYFSRTIVDKYYVFKQACSLSVRCVRQ